MFKADASLFKTKSVLFFTIFLGLVMMAAACAPVTYNRYQSAHSMAQGEWQATVSAELGRDMVMPTYPYLEIEMKEKMREYTQEHTGHYDFEGAIEDLAETFALLAIMSPGAALGFPIPQTSLELGYGVTDRWDLHLGVTASGYVHANTKFELTRFGEHGALAMVPGLGFLHFNQGPDEVDDHDFTMEDSYTGNVFTVEMPFLVGWQFKHLSPYLGLHTSYHHTEIDFRRKIVELNPDFDTTISFAYDAVNIGLIAGLEWKLKYFVLTPELTALYSPPLQEDIMPVLFLSPGVAIGARW